MIVTYVPFFFFKTIAIMFSSICEGAYGTKYWWWWYKNDSYRYTYEHKTASVYRIIHTELFFVCYKCYNQSLSQWIIWIVQSNDIMHIWITNITITIMKMNMIEHLYIIKEKTDAVYIYKFFRSSWTMILYINNI